MNNMTLPLPNPDDWLDTDQAALLLGVSRRTIGRLGDGPAIQPYKIGKVTLYWRSDVEKVREARKLLGRKAE